MTNCNRKITEKKSRENQGRIEKMNVYIPIVSMVISVFAVIISACGLLASWYFSEKEYSYKIEPELEFSYATEIQVQAGEQLPDVRLSDIYVELLEKNNLDEVYVINANNEVERLELEDVENYFEVEIQKKFGKESADLVTDMFEYHYQYIFLKNLNGECNLYIIYLKRKNEMFTLNAISGMEVYALEHSHKEEAEYEGERVMAEQYHEILQYVKEWIY